MFLVNSRFPLLSAAIPRSTRKGASRVRPPFSLSYGGNLPSSLTTVRPSPRYSLPDHLSWFGVRAARNSLEAFLGSIGSSNSPHSAMRQASPTYGPDLPGPRATPLHRYYHSPVGLPSCVTPSLAYYQSGSRASPGPRSSKEPDTGVRAVSIAGFSMGVPSRVREYQPVVHRLRLSASP